jgi:hypothetical protein
VLPTPLLADRVLATPLDLAQSLARRLARNLLEHIPTLRPPLTQRRDDPEPRRVLDLLGGPYWEDLVVLHLGYEPCEVLVVETFVPI